MSATDLTLEVRHDSGGATVIICEGELDIATVARLADAVAWSLTADVGRLRIDATKVTFCDSAGLGSLLDAAYQCRQRGARLQLAASPRLANTLELCGVPVTASDEALLADLTDALTDPVTAKIARSQPAS